MATVSLTSNTTSAAVLDGSETVQVFMPGKRPDELLVSTALTDLEVGYGETEPGDFHPISGTLSLTPPPSGWLWLWSATGGAVQLTAVVAGDRP